ncbi:hypothetical protein KK120_19485 [Virgibacillus dakarensis]|nr:hypothetical protein [Virgibacillus dakarensis]
MKKEEPVKKKKEDKVKATENIEEPKKKGKRKEYKEDDLRYLLQRGNEEEKSPYQVLLEKEFIEDTSKWIEVEGI